MEKKLQLDIDFLNENDAYHTANEIQQQPNMWLKTQQIIESQKEEFLHFIRPLITKNNIRIILTGAGTSAFIGNTVVGTVQKKFGCQTCSIPTTDFITHPELYISDKVTTLLISFARSGNSPESIKAVQLADQLSENVHHLIITCNEEGALAREASKKNYVLLLPKETNDVSLAMTSSFSSMLLSILILGDLINGEDFSQKVSITAEYVNVILNEYVPLIKEIADIDFNRAIFLGSGPMRGIAQEGHLKLQELTDGNVICKFDSFLGFRHGPRAVINDKSIIIYMFSNQEYINKYEIDLVNSIENSKNGILRLGLMETDIQGICLNKKIIYSDRHKLEDAYLSLCHVIPAQMLGFYKSLQLGFKPDNPSESGTISRVVQGVNLYPYKQVK
ncbi:MAG: SIS domain-containing protein [Calditrichaeota bacterium]|nr:SIS domain-containing protein [Calditrichota bacterium]